MPKKHPQSQPLRLKVPLPDPLPAFGYSTPAVGLGSCFVEAVGSRLQRLKLPVALNPMGIQYNPLALSRTLQYGLGEVAFAEDDLIESQGIWQHFDFHGVLGHPEREAAARQMQLAVEKLKRAVAGMDRLIITLGTAFVYEHLASGQVVANCHKVPANAFRKYRLSPKAIVDALQPVLSACKARRPGLEVVLTVSPVRHIRDGVVENQRSKAALLLAAEALAEAEYVHYFPSYELMMDELRDYRFYKTDFVHPSEEAVDYIWSCFASVAFEESTQEQLEAVEAIVRASEHRPLFPASAAHQAFVRQQLQRIAQLEVHLPQADFSPERERLQSALLK
ncbi:MAG: GSCFA domain-containing protein [Phaeodactylibacter xiamenensis]|uniref:GSCFA domain-containing protein n=1 Tax=Phaeodactylibacter xiamenensis TaxID=1524460 RepID=UPI0006989C3C|nr:GSCFA domain-containing protein [Phaeodactylibacter xiamenensis]MCR9053723.1 GSCFA domain-containing protein [bacterium]